MANSHLQIGQDNQSMTGLLHTCERCRRMRKKCDALLPSCRNCEKVRSECLFFDNVLQEVLPRSYVHSLQLQLKGLQERKAALQDAAKSPKPLVSEGVLLEHPAGDTSHVMLEQSIVPSYGLDEDASPPQLPLATSSRQELHALECARQEIRGSVELQDMLSITIPLGHNLTDVTRRVRMGLTPSHLLYPSRGKEVQKNQPVKTHDGLEYVNATVLFSLPSHVMHTLVRKYIQKMLPIYPFLHKPTVLRQLDRVLSIITQRRQSIEDTDIPTAKLDYDFLVVYLILSISATLGAKDGHKARRIAFSQSLFVEGIKHFSNTAPYPSDLAWIQVTLLILQYASINPKSGNVWILSGFAMRNCLELGLHREAAPDIDPSLNPTTVDMRRRVFWAAYCMDRSICGVLQRPFSIPDLAIDAQPISLIEDSNITCSGVNVDQLAKNTAVYWIQYWQYQSSVMEVHFRERLLGLQTWQDWLAVMEQKLRQWCENVPHDGWTEFAFMHGLASLHRPSPRNPIPTPDSLLKAFESACASARLCRQQLLTGSFPRLWFAAHHTFEMALVVLFCLRHNWGGISARFTSEEIFEMTKLFTANFLTIAAQGWIEIVEYGGIYERLLGPSLTPLFEPGKEAPDVDPERDAELMRLLYPSPAGFKSLKLPSGEGWYDGEHLPYDHNLFNWEEDALLDEINVLGYRP